MRDEELLVRALIISARHDLSRGIRRDLLLKSLSSVISSDLFMKVKDKI